MLIIHNAVSSPDVDAWHMLEIPFFGRLLWVLRSASKGCEAALGIRKKLVQGLQTSSIPKEPLHAPLLLELDISFSLTANVWVKYCTIGRPTPHNDVDIFLGIVPKGEPFPALHAEFIPVYCWGMKNQKCGFLHQLSYRNREGSVLRLTPQK